MLTRRCLLCGVVFPYRDAMVDKICPSCAETQKHKVKELREEEKEYSRKKNKKSKTR